MPIVIRVVKNAFKVPYLQIPIQLGRFVRCKVPVAGSLGEQIHAVKVGSCEVDREKVVTNDMPNLKAAANKP